MKFVGAGCEFEFFNGLFLDNRCEVKSPLLLKFYLNLKYACFFSIIVK